MKKICHNNLKLGPFFNYLTRMNGMNNTNKFVHVIVCDEKNDKHSRRERNFLRIFQRLLFFFTLSPFVVQKVELHISGLATLEKKNTWIPWNCSKSESTLIAPTHLRYPKPQEPHFHSMMSMKEGVQLCPGCHFRTPDAVTVPLFISCFPFRLYVCFILPLYVQSVNSIGRVRLRQNDARRVPLRLISG